MADDEPRNWATQRAVDAAYGVLFLAGVAYLAYRMEPLVVAFEAGLVAGYALHLWDKMALYEAAMEAVTRRADRRAAAEAEDSLTPATDEHMRVEGYEVDD
jgi:hypothetical protein